jgi:hypothetical protein
MSTQQLNTEIICNHGIIIEKNVQTANEQVYFSWLSCTTPLFHSTKAGGLEAFLSK